MPESAPSAAVVTPAQLAAPTAAVSAMRTSAVRSQTPPVGRAIEPSTLWPGWWASAGKSRPAAATGAVPVIVSPVSSTIAPVHPASSTGQERSPSASRSAAATS